MFEQRRRIRSVSRRGDKILALLSESGPMSIPQICEELGVDQHFVRYAVGALVGDGKAHIQHFDRVVSNKGMRHQVAFYAAGHGENAVAQPDQKLDFESTAMLQAIYMHWAETRYPPILEPDDEV